MYWLCRTVTAAAAALWLVSGCAPNAPPDSQAEKREPEPASPEPMQEANGTEDESDPAAQAKGQSEQQDSHENTDKAASGTKDEAEWSPESAATVIERARSRLKRRCDRGSQ